MAKYDNLDYKASNKLKALYEAANPKPEKPDDHDDPHFEAPKLIRAQAETRLYLEPTEEHTGMRYHSSSHIEAKLRLVVCINGENHKAEISADEAEDFIKELRRMIDAVDDINDARKRSLEAQKKYREAQEAWDAKRENDLTLALNRKEITSNQILAAESLKDLGI